MRLSTCAFLPPLPLSFGLSHLLHAHKQEEKKEKHKDVHTDTQTPCVSFPVIFSPSADQAVHSSLNTECGGSPDAWVSVNVVLLLAGF